MRIRAKPVTVTAVQWGGENFRELQEFAGTNKVEQEDGKTFVYVHGEKTLLSLGDVVFKHPTDEEEPLRFCTLGELRENFDRVCGLCDQPADKFFVVPTALDERKHGICAPCETQGLAENAAGSEGSSE